MSTSRMQATHTRAGTFASWWLGLSALTAALVPALSGGRGKVFLLTFTGAAGALLLLRWPHLGIFATVVAQAVELPAGPDASRLLQVPYLVGAVLAVPFIVKVFVEREVAVLRIPQVRILLAIGALYLLSTAWSEVESLKVLTPGTDKTNWLLFAFLSRLGLLVLFVSFITTRAQAESVAWLLVGVITLAAVDSWGSHSEGEALERAAASFGHGTNANRLAFICLFATAFLWFFRSHGPSHSWKPLVLPLLFFLPATAFSTGSRSGFLQALVLVVLILGEQRRATLLQRASSFLLLAAAGLFLLSVVPDTMIERATSFGESAAHGGQVSMENRAHGVRTAIELFFEHPFLGVGIGNFEALTVSAYEMGRGPHNSYLRALSEGGIGVFALYVALFAVTLRALARASAEEPLETVWLVKGVRTAFVVFLVYSGTADVWQNDYLYFLLGLSIVLTRSAR